MPYVTLSAVCLCRRCGAVLNADERAFEKSEDIHICLRCCRILHEAKRKSSPPPAPTREKQPAPRTDRKKHDRLKALAEMSEKKRAWYTTPHETDPILQARGSLLIELKEADRMRKETGKDLF